ncbi:MULTISPECIES: phosphatidylglycerophosphatase A [Maritimibacter]|jgi:phosphatidylglycerophosphatase A|uniref:Phosphatidylglycerophosphatase A n=1 Tax=Maritimibacter alkaliphilus HTCC2654 TaxID=314271 RepID=A3VDU8_9RHOB|nr:MULTISPECIES: phosphatidylglycerophosphatase A [Maritimibacter]EAQ13687.1 phosphatidylglycerophosphatase, putative [Maritimibacter alkaliphilus HTCC2654]TYP83524.1 phosphatidylglycerophosphatase A [Maritimibacter alkaliphilus HTCC2654]
MSRVIATFLFTGYLKPASGTWGSLFALPLIWALHQLGGPLAIAIGAVVLFAAGLWATQQMTAELGIEDPSEIVIDEVVGQALAILPVSIGAMGVGVDVLKLWPGWVAGFLLFRLFDIWKPWLVGWADRRGDPLGVMLDDVIAGVFAGIGVLILAALSHLIILV